MATELRKTYLLEISTVHSLSSPGYWMLNSGDLRGTQVPQEYSESQRLTRRFCTLMGAEEVIDEWTQKGNRDDWTSRSLFVVLTFPNDFSRSVTYMIRFIPEMGLLDLDEYVLTFRRHCIVNQIGA